MGIYLRIITKGLPVPTFPVLLLTNLVYLGFTWVMIFDLASDAVKRIDTTWLLGRLATQQRCKHLLKRNIQNMVNQ